MQTAITRAHKRLVTHHTLNGNQRSTEIKRRRRCCSTGLCVYAQSNTQNTESTLEQSREDEVLPNSLFDSVNRAALRTFDAFDAGSGLALVELLVPELWDATSGNVMGQQGDQERMWELTREFAERLQANFTPEEGRVRSVYPDAGAAALLQSTWGNEHSFELSSLNEPDVLANNPACIVLACPDPPSAEKAISIAYQAEEQDIPLVMFNPRLNSGDVGVGTNVRELRNNFFSRFVTSYSLRPIDGGTVFKEFGAGWKVFLADPEADGRYKLISHTRERIAGEELEDLIVSYLEKEQQPSSEVESGTGGANPLQQVSRALSSMQRFVKSLS